jgi:hypothetical protein
MAAKREFHMIMIVLLLFFSALACNYVEQLTSSDDSQEPSDDFVSPTPNLTMTAIFGGPTATLVPTTTPELVEEEPSPTPEDDLGDDAKGGTPSDSDEDDEAAVSKTGFSRAPEGDQGITHALFVENKPNIDADLIDWVGFQYTASYAVYGEGYYSGAEDVSADFKIGWDLDNIYIGSRVYDNKFTQIDSGKLLFLGDSIEIVLDIDLESDPDDTELSDDDYQVGLSPGNLLEEGSPDAYLWFPRIEARPLRDLEIAAELTDDGYFIEAAIPWDVFGVEAQFGKRFGFAFSVSDNDTNDGSGQQTMVSNMQDRHLTDPTTWGELVLVIP